MADFPTRFYRADNGTLFRIASGGVFSTWNPNTKTWFHVTDKAGRDYLSRAVENGDATPVKASEAATLAR